MRSIMNERPIAFITFFFVAGVVLSYYLQWEIIPLAVLGCFFIAIIIGLIVKKSMYSLIWVYIICFLLGGFLFACQNQKKMLDINPNQRYTVRGRVTDINRGEYNQYCVKDVQIADGKQMIMTAQKIFVYTAEPMEYGDIVEFETTIQLPDTPRNPGGFNEKTYSLAHKLDFSCFVHDARVIGHKNGWYAPFLWLRDYTADQIDKYYTQDTAPVAKAMFLGMHREVAEDTKTTFETAGVAYILAVSGLHISAVTAFVQFLLSKMRLSRNLRYPLHMIILLFYGLMVGASSSLLRAVIMAELVLLGRWIFLKRDPITFLSIAALVVLLYSPAQLFMPGFVLSFGIMLGIVFIRPPLLRLLSHIRMPDALADMLSMSVSAGVVAMPLTASIFGTVSLFSVLSSLYAVPLAGLIVCGTAAFSVFSLVPVLGAIVAFVPQVAIQLLMHMNQTFIRYGMQTLPIWHFPVVAALLCFATFFVLSDYLFLTKKTKAITSMLLAILCLVVWGGYSKMQQPKLLQMTVLDVGAGDVIHLKTKESDVLLDNGGVVRRSNVRKYTEDNGIIYDLVVQTNDRSNNLKDIMAADQVKSMRVPDFYQPKSFEKNVEMMEYKLYDKIDIGEGMTVDVVAQDGKHSTLAVMLNDQMLCLLMQNRAEELPETLGQVDIIKLPMSGARDTMSVQMLKSLHPQVAIISSGRPGSSAEPDVETKAIVVANSAKIYETGRQGAVTVRWSDVGQYTIQTMK